MFFFSCVTLWCVHLQLSIAHVFILPGSIPSTHLAWLLLQDPLPSWLVQWGAKSFCWAASGAAEGAAQLMSCVQGEEMLGLEESSGDLHLCPSAAKSWVITAPVLVPLLSKVHHCLCKLFFMNQASLPGPSRGVCFAENTGIAVCVGEGNYTAEEREPALQKYFKSGVPNLFFSCLNFIMMMKNCCCRITE